MNYQKILYVHNANFDSIEANKLQVMNMCNAFRESGCDVTLFGFGNLNYVKKNY